LMCGGPEVTLTCCNNNVDVGKLIDFARGVEGGSVTELGGEVYNPFVCKHPS